MAKSFLLSSPRTSGNRARVRVCENRRATHVLQIEDRVEAGLKLVGTEVKSLRAGRAHLTDAYVQVMSGQATVIGMHIAEYSHGHHFNHPPTRSRRLLMHRKEIEKLEEKLTKQGYTALALELYFNESGIAKLLIGVGRGKGHRDKRDDIKAREADRDVARVMRTARR